MKIGFFITARLKSERLKLKILLDLNGKTVLDRVIERCKSTPGIDDVILCTSRNSQDSLLYDYALKHNIEFDSKTENYFYSTGSIASYRYIIVKPTTYVNLSGIAAKNIIDNNNIHLDNFLVVADDINLSLGKIRIRTSGGDGGHNGLSSIIYHLQTENFPRLRFGIGSEFRDGEMKDYVLTQFDKETLEYLEPQFNHTTNLINEFIMGGMTSMLNYYSTLVQHQNSNKSNNLEGKQEV